MRFLFCFSLCFIFTTSCFAHVFSTMYKGFEHFGKDDGYYIRIKPSPYLDGYYSYSLCPIFNNNADNYIDENKITRYDEYTHGLNHQGCINPYGLYDGDNLIYFNAYDLTWTLNNDDIKYHGLEAAKFAAAIAVTMAFPVASTALMASRTVALSARVVKSTKLVQAYSRYQKSIQGLGEFVTSSNGLNMPRVVVMATDMLDPLVVGAGVSTYLAADYTINNTADKTYGQKMYFELGNAKSPYIEPKVIDAEVMRSITKISYFTGQTHPNGSDLVWPSVPQKLKTRSEMIQECRYLQKRKREENQKAYEAQRMAMDPLTRSMVEIRESTTLVPETVAGLNPLKNVDECAHYVSPDMLELLENIQEERNISLSGFEFPQIRTTMRKFWESITLPIIYKAGWDPRESRVSPSNTDDFVEYFNNEGRFEESHWEPVSKDFPNHYYTAKNQVPPSLIYTCDHLRVTAYRKHLKTTGQSRSSYTMQKWFDEQCKHAFEIDNRKCREHFDDSTFFTSGSVKKGSEICSIL
ncbi:MAG: hypothetical protein KDD46_05625 [Bdellovibrionales bacterium]|nr:hypothetical protein [Bdellovibrionales bacterium]